MVLESYGHVVSEMELRQRCECDDDGTYPSKVVEVAKRAGLSQSLLIRNLQFDQLQELLSEGLYPIVWLKVMVDQVTVNHSVIVVEITEGQINMLDPTTRERALGVEEFKRAWFAENGTIIIK